MVMSSILISSAGELEVKWSAISLTCVRSMGKLESGTEVTPTASGSGGADTDTVSFVMVTVTVAARSAKPMVKSMLVAADRSTSTFPFRP